MRPADPTGGDVKLDLDSQLPRTLLSAYPGVKLPVPVMT